MWCPGDDSIMLLSDVMDIERTEEIWGENEKEKKGRERKRKRE